MVSVLAHVSLVINNVHFNTSMLLQAYEKTQTAGKKWAINFINGSCFIYQILNQ